MLLRCVCVNGKPEVGSARWLGPGSGIRVTNIQGEQHPGARRTFIGGRSRHDQRRAHRQSGATLKILMNMTLRWQRILVQRMQQSRNQRLACLGTMWMQLAANAPLWWQVGLDFVPWHLQEAQLDISDDTQQRAGKTRRELPWPV